MDFANELDVSVQVWEISEDGIKILLGVNIVKLKYRFSGDGL